MTIWLDIFRIFGKSGIQPEGRFSAPLVKGWPSLMVDEKCLY